MSSLDDLLDDSPVKEEEIVRRESCPPTKSQKARQQSLLGLSDSKKTNEEIVLTDEPFNIRIKSPVVDSQALRILCEGMQKVLICSRTKPPESSWVTVAVIVEKQSCTSSNGNPYLLWRLHDLKNCEDKSRKVLLFGESAKQHWKLQKGFVVALLSPQSIDDEKSKEITLKVINSCQVVLLGSSVDYSICKGVRTDGSRCSHIVNMAKCDYCVFHASQQARKYSSRRGTFGQQNGTPQNPQPRPSLSRPMPPPRLVSTNNVSSAEVVKCEKEELGRLLETRKFSLGAKCLSGGTQKPVITKTANKASMKEFISERSVGTREEDAVSRAIAILNTKKTEVKRNKRPLTNDVPSTSTPNVSREKVLALLGKRSRHENEVQAKTHELELQYLDNLERREQVETTMTECSQLKDVRVFSCTVCKYTARSRSALCVKQGHNVTTHMSDKRFFRCTDCHQRTFAYGLHPTHACTKCHGHSFERVAMVDERKVTLENEQLLLRGEERSFVHS